MMLGSWRLCNNAVADHSMQPERTEKVRSVLVAALARQPEERRAFLEQACGEDRELRRQVEHHLFIGEKTEQFNFQPNPVRIENQPFVDHGAVTIVDGKSIDTRVSGEYGKYVVQTKLAEGGMGIVYIALDTQLGREVAIKILPEYFSRDSERLQRFYREARATSLLNHPNIVTVFELGQRNDCHYIVSEFVAGQTLREKMNQGAIPLVEILKITSQIASALDAAHRADIVHRDVKPENVMIRPDGYVKVLDFGLAKVSEALGQAISGEIVHSGQRFDNTVPGAIMGTAAYMSPEQAEGTETDSRADIWSLGVLLYEMISGSLPFDGPSPSHTIVAILEQDPEPLDHPSHELRQIISTALQKKKEHRFQTAEAMSTALDELRHRLGYFSDQNIVGTEPADIKVPIVDHKTNRVSPYAKLFWLVPSAFAALLALTLGIYVVATWLFDTPSSRRPNPSVANIVVPTPERSVETKSLLETPTPKTIYVEPTPQPTITGQSDINESPVERKKPLSVPLPVKTSRPASVSSTPKKDKPKQDPNCVFTNSCH